MNEEETIAESRAWIKAHKKEITKKFAEGVLPIPDVKPFVIFMAGSPGAGKTETSKNFIKEFEQLYFDNSGKKSRAIKVVRIDPDEIREMLPGYNGTNAELYQSPSSLGVEKVYDYVMKKDLSVIVDGTLASYEVAFKESPARTPCGVPKDPQG